MSSYPSNHHHHHHHHHHHDAVGGAATGTGATGGGPILLRSEEVPPDVICSICLSLPLHPVLTKTCHHMFCAECLTSLWNSSSTTTTTAASAAVVCCCCCPIDRRPLTMPDDIQPVEEGTFAHRIWSTIPVKCEHTNKGCAWIGSVSDYEAHIQQTCRYNDDNNNTQQKQQEQEQVKRLQCRIEELEEEVSTLRTQLDNAQTLSSALALGAYRRQQQQEKQQQQQQQQQQQLQQHNNNTPTSTTTTSTTTTALSSSSSPTTATTATTTPTPIIKLRPDYDYTRDHHHDVVELSQLISQHLHHKPSHMNSHRMFQCIRNCYREFLYCHHSSRSSRSSSNSSKEHNHHHNHNPQQAHVHMRMLLSTCVSTKTWFTPNQMNRMHTWMVEQEWE